jgi:6-phosphogluconolactonase
MSGEPTIRVFDVPATTAAAAAEAIVAALVDSVERRGRADWATTGGSAPIPIYRALIEPRLRDAVPWASVHVWWGDDRYVGRADPLSNVLAFDREFLPSVPLPAENVHAMRMDEAIDADAGPGMVASAYEAEMRAADLPVDDADVPHLDVVLVGLGDDGHVLSAFPGSPLFDEAGWVSPVPAPTHIEPHVARVSFHPAILAAARLPMLVTFGAGKAATIASVLGPDRDERRIPAQVARREGALWFLDRDAAAQLPG